jgi:hypothetical protein
VSHKSNENKISDGYRERAPIEVEVGLIMEIVIAQRVAVRCIAGLDGWRAMSMIAHYDNEPEENEERGQE